MNNLILIFPGGMPRSLEYLAQLTHEGIGVIGASSVVDDPYKSRYKNWVYLPYINANNFNYALKTVIFENNINGIFTPNPVVWEHLKNCLKKIAPEVNLINESPFNKELYPYRLSKSFAEKFLVSQPIFKSKIQPKPKLSKIHIASILKHSETIPGMCDHEKTLALFEIFNQAPQGDVVEIGSWWGKSAYLLLELARLNDIGNVLCVDPWQDSNLPQGDILLDKVSSQLSADEAFEVFILNLLPYSFGNINYLRMTSVEGGKYFKANNIVKSIEFGSTNFKGKIAVLHIDGNHSYEAVKADVETWACLVEKNGWIIFDDYVWPFGDGPKLIADEFIKKNSNNISVIFEKGSSLFIQLSACI